MSSSPRSISLVDTHAHLQSIGLSEGDRGTRELWAKAPELTGDGVVQAAREAGVTKLICVGCDLQDSELAIEFVKNRENCWASIGIHPHEAAVSLGRGLALRELAALTSQPKVVAIGECGLDYFYEHSPKEDQIRALKFQLNLAHDAGLPLIFHVREAFDDFWPLFDEFPKGSLRGVLHSFTDSQANLNKALERGLFIGVNGIATFAKAENQLEMYKAVPLERLVLETDAPFLTPVPFRGKINESKQIRTIAEFLAQLRSESLADLAAQTTANAVGLFDIK